MLLNFSVENFKNFENKIEIDFTNTKGYEFNKECLKDGIINNAIIYGKNGTGKSNLGKALRDIATILTGKSILFGDEEKHYINANSNKKYATFSYSFKINNTIVKYEYKKTSSKNIVYEKLIMDDTAIFEYDFINNKLVKDNLKSINAETLNFNDLRNIPSIITYIFNNTVLDKNSTFYLFIKFIDKMFYINSISSTLDEVYKTIIENNLITDFNTFLKEAGIKETVVKAKEVDGTEILCINYKNKKIPFYISASNGTKSLALFFYWYKNIDRHGSKLLFLDEFDAYYHYDLSRFVVDKLKEIDNVQVMFTTHNTNLLTNKILRPDCYFILSDNKIISLPNATKRELREGHNLEKLYIGGDFTV